MQRRSLQGNTGTVSVPGDGLGFCGRVEAELESSGLDNIRPAPSTGIFSRLFTEYLLTQNRVLNWII